MPPAVLAPIALGISAVGAVAGGIAQGNAAAYQGKVAANNAIIARQNAQYSASAAAAQTEQAGLKARQQLSGVRAGAAATGVDVNSGSAADVQSSEHQIGALDTATVANNAALKVYGYQTQASNYDSQSRLDAAEAGFAPIAGGLKAAGDIASGWGDAFPSSGSGSGGEGVPEDWSSISGSNFSSLVSGPPTVGNDFLHMYSPNNPTSLEF